MGAEATKAKSTWHSVVISVRRQSPDHPPKVEPGSGMAWSVTIVLMSYTAEQVAPHSMPAGVLRTIPPPTPVRPTVITRRRTGVANRLLPLSGSPAVALLTVAVHW